MGRMVLLICVGVVVLLVVFGFAYLIAYDQREKPIHVYVRSAPDHPPYYPESVRRFLEDES